MNIRIGHTTVDFLLLCKEPSVVLNLRLDHIGSSLVNDTF